MGIVEAVLSIFVLSVLAITAGYGLIMRLNRGRKPAVDTLIEPLWLKPFSDLGLDVRLLDDSESCVQRANYAICVARKPLTGACRCCGKPRMAIGETVGSRYANSHLVSWFGFACAHCGDATRLTNARGGFLCTWLGPNGNLFDAAQALKSHSGQGLHAMLSQTLLERGRAAAAWAADAGIVADELGNQHDTQPLPRTTSSPALPAASAQPETVPQAATGAGAKVLAFTKTPRRRRTRPGTKDET